MTPSRINDLTPGPPAPPVSRFLVRARQHACRHGRGQRAALFWLLTLMASSCVVDRTTDVRIVNRCSTAVELEPHQTSVPERLRWSVVAPGESFTTSGTASWSTVYLWVRLVGSETVPDPFTFRVSDYSSGSAGVVDAEIVLEDELCPT